jgi:hypothetical protein
MRRAASDTALTIIDRSNTTRKRPNRRTASSGACFVMAMAGTPFQAPYRWPKSTPRSNLARTGRADPSRGTPARIPAEEGRGCCIGPCRNSACSALPQPKTVLVRRVRMRTAIRRWRSDEKLPGALTLDRLITGRRPLWASTCGGGPRHACGSAPPSSVNPMRSRTESSARTVSAAMASRWK